MRHLSIYCFLKDVKREFHLTDEQFKEFQRVSNSTETMENVEHRRIYRKLERRKRQHELAINRNNNCIQQ